MRTLHRESHPYIVELSSLIATKTDFRCRTHCIQLQSKYIVGRPAILDLAVTVIHWPLHSCLVMIYYSFRIEIAEIQYFLI